MKHRKRTIDSIHIYGSIKSDPSGANHTTVQQGIEPMQNDFNSLGNALRSSTNIKGNESGNKAPRGNSISPHRGSIVKEQQHRNRIARQRKLGEMGDGARAYVVLDLADDGAAKGVEVSPSYLRRRTTYAAVGCRRLS